MSPSYERPLLPFHASLGVSHLQAPPSIPSSVDTQAGIKGSSLELLCPSAFSGLRTLLFIPLGTFQKPCPSPGKPPPQGLATLSRIFLVLQPTEASFNSPRSWASPLEALLLHSDRKDVSLSPLRSCAFPQNLPGFESALQRFSPAMKAVPLYAPGWIRSGRGPGSLRAFDLSGSPSEFDLSRASLPRSFPSDVALSRPSRNGLRSPSGAFTSNPARLFPFQGAGLSGLFAVRRSRSIRTLPLRGLFFPLQGPSNVATQKLPFFADRPDSPCGRA